jgi:CheY-like chemotaxis protein
MVNILWVDDEIDLLKPYVLFLEAKGYGIIPAIDGNEALEVLSEKTIDIVFLDENMPGLTGLEVLNLIKAKYPNLPVIMITKSEEEHIMEQAIGSKISDYLIKPVNPNQILLILKKHLETRRLVSEQSTMNYQQEFREIGLRLMGNMNNEEWIDIYRKLVYWEIELAESNDKSIFEILKQQKTEANLQFSKYYEKKYQSWLKGENEDLPLLSYRLLKEKLFPALKEDKPTFLIVIDNFRFDQWKALQPMMEQYLRVEKEELYYSIIPTTTQFARNSIFAGLMPYDIKKTYPDLWLDEDEEGNKNQNEYIFLQKQLARNGFDIKTTYHKVLNLSYGRKMIENLPNLMKNKLNVIVYNFIDMLSHARTDSDLVRELADDEKGYRSVTQAWFSNSPLLEVLKFLSNKDVNIFITTDHGSVKVNRPIKIKATKEASVNLRYKVCRLLEYNEKDVFAVNKPEDILLPRLNMLSPYIFAKANDFFAYPNNYNHYVQYYKNTFQHGGISMEEVLIPFIHLTKK